jgi:predicted O-linked N-acetylglucosamine transferase (SPINDLY family)
VAKLTINRALKQAVDAHKAGKMQKAHRLYAAILKAQPKHPDANHNTGLLTVGFGKIELALPFFKTALEANPSNAQFWYSHIVALIKLERLIDAKVLLDQAKSKGIKGADFDQLEQKLDDADAYNNMGNALQKQNKLEEAIEAYNKALGIKPDYVNAYYNIGIALQKQNKLEEATEAFNKALKIKPDYADARTQKLHQQAHMCKWDSIADDVNLIPELGTLEKHVSPLALLSLEDAPDRHLIRSKIYANAKYPQKPLTLKNKPSKRPKRIRIGYFSTDFRKHPVAYLIAKVLEQHNRDQFEVFGYSLHGSSSCEMRQRLEKSFDRFTDVQDMSDSDIALQARQDEIDIAVDLNGYTQNSRPRIFAYRAAPIQINYLGYPGTLGADFMDYIVADRFLIPGENQKYFNEKPLYLPNTYMPTDDCREISQKPMSRSDMGLSDCAFIFCCFNNNYKISPNEFDIWMRLLTKVENSVLWLRKSNQFSIINIKNEAQKRKVDPSRLVFADELPMDEHLARQRLADLFLDTFAFNAHTTATEALWAGLPIVTKLGKGFAARVAGSLLNAVDLPELITETEEDYEALILKLATNPTKLAKIKEKLANNRLNQPLFNTELYTRHLENGYQQAYQNYFDGNLPQTIMVPK